MHRGLVALVASTLVLQTSSPRAQEPLRARVIASGLTSPVLFAPDPVTPGAYFIVEQAGRVRVLRAGTLIETDFLDLRGAIDAGGERGLLGLAAAPDGRVFVNFTDARGDTVIARFRRSVDPLVADPASRFDLRWNGTGAPAAIPQPYGNHNGGHLAFGPDAYLYIGLGDGGSGNDPEHRAQNLTTLLGKMLRVDVNVPDTDPVGYRVPPDNPFVAAAGVRPEIWSVGLRNPWRFSFDPPALGGTGALLIADVGQNRYEEIDFEPAGRGGRNYGWRNREGAHDNIASPGPAYQPLIDPIYEYDHGTGQSITGGVVYRGRALGSTYQGRYFFADFVQGRVWSLALSQAGAGSASGVIDHTAELSVAGGIGTISSLDVDRSGEMYIVAYTRGLILQISGPSTAPAAPANLRIIR